jgi:hypothetical protein
MLKTAPFALLLALSSSTILAEGQEAGNPENEAAAELKALQKKWGRFAPSGWRVVMAKTGNVLGPKSDDALVVVEEENPAKIVSNDGLGMDKLNTNPRALLLLAAKGKDYAVARRFDGFLPSEGNPESPCLADPLLEGPGIEIKNQVVTISLHYWYSCGSWYVNRNDYKFRSEKNSLRLIGMESWSVHRASGMGDTTSINFLTGRKKHVDNVAGLGPEPELAEGEERPEPSTKWSNVARGPFYLDRMARKDCDNYEKAPSWCGY